MITRWAFRSHVPPDSCRTAVRNLVRRGVPEKVAMAFVGWKSRQMLDRYNVVSTSDLHEAARRLDQLALPPSGRG
jgi:hypothetical protein